MKNFNGLHIVRWSELPSIDLYKEQVVDLVNLNLFQLGLRPITSSMINNYTKLKWIPIPINKKYSKKHVSHIMVIALLKDIFELSEIVKGIHLSKESLGLDIAYDCFIDEIERAVKLVSIEKSEEVLNLEELSTPQRIMRYTALSFAFHRFTRNLLIEREGINHEA